MSLDTTRLPPLPPFTYADLARLAAEQQRLKVHGMQQFLRRFAAVLDYVDDALLPIPVIGEVVDAIVASPILLAGALGATEQLLRGQPRGAMAEVVGSLVEAAVTALPGVEVADIATGPVLGKRTATMAREWAEQRIVGGKFRRGWWTTTPDREAYYVEPDDEGFLVSHYGRADAVRVSPLMTVRYDSQGPRAIWTPTAADWLPLASSGGQPTTRLP